MVDCPGEEVQMARRKWLTTYACKTRGMSRLTKKLRARARADPPVFPPKVKTKTPSTCRGVCGQPGYKDEGALVGMSPTGTEVACTMLSGKEY